MNFFKEADFVALVQVVEGKTIIPLDDDCGSNYKGYVIKRFKGNSLQNVEFGHFDGLMIGSRYLVFLTKPDVKYRSLRSTNSISTTLEQEKKQKCIKEWTSMNVMQGIHGAMLVEQPDYFNWAVKVPTRFIGIPESFKVTPITGTTSVDYYSDPVWILEMELFKLIESFNQSK